MCASLGRGAVSAKCTAGPNASGYFSVSLGVTLDCPETPFAKTPLSWFLMEGPRESCEWWLGSQRYGPIS